MLGANVLLLGKLFPTLRNGVDEDHVSVGGVGEVYPIWDLLEQDLLVWFHHRKVFALGVITDFVLLSNYIEGEDGSNGAIIKQHFPIDF